MAAYDLEEQERIAALKDWWAEWSKWVYMALAAFFLGIGSTQAWRYYQKNETASAETVFKELRTTAQEAAASKEWKKLASAAVALSDKYPRTFYASEARLMAAKAAFDAGELAEAQTHLEWVAANGRDAVRSVARLRLAAVLLDAKKYDEALKTLDQIKDDGFIAPVADLRGDVYAAQNRRDEARAAYEMAVEKSDSRSPLKNTAQAKLDAFGGATPKPADTKDKTGKDGKKDGQK